MERIKTLLVDDSPDFLERAARFLSAGDTLELVGTARSGEEGIALAAALRPQLVVLDFELPDLKGPAVAARIKAIDSSIRIVIATLHSDPLYRQRSLEGGADEFIPKPELPTKFFPVVSALFPRPTGTARKDHDMSTEPFSDRPQRGILPETSNDPDPVAMRLFRVEQELAVVRSVCRALSVCVDLDFLLREAVVPAASAVGASHALILRDDGEGPLAIHAGLGFSGLDPEEIRLAVIEAFHGSPSIVSGTPYVLDLDPMGEIGGSLAEILALFGLRSAMLVPLRFDDRIDAALLVASADRKFLDPTVRKATIEVGSRITEAMRLALAFHRLERQERRATSLFESAGDAIVVVDLDGRIVQANRRSEALLRQPTSRLMGKSWADLVTLLDRTRHAEWFHTAMIRTDDAIAGLGVTRGDGSVVRLDVSAGQSRVDGETLTVLILRDSGAEKPTD